MAVNVSEIEFRNLSTSPSDRGLLHQFYHGLYLSGFPDENERESLENMVRYLKLREQGWYGRNSYHIVIARHGERILGCAISDYLVEPNCGVIEFLLVDEGTRGLGIGRRLHEATVELLQQDAAKALGTPLAAVAIEMNDPFRVDPATDNMDPTARARTWGSWGYGVLDCRYVQPALSEEQGPVDYLLLGAKPLDERLKKGFPSPMVRDIVHSYLKWAMRIDEPEKDTTFQMMEQGLLGSASIRWIPFETYLSQPPGQSS